MPRAQQRSHPHPVPPEHGIVGRSKIMRAVIEAAARVAATLMSVLLVGASGTGKELLARFIHAASERAKGPFVAINCGALPEGILEDLLFGHVKGAFTGAVDSKPGLIEAAHGGTLFLDEVGEMSPRLQVKLLRVLENGKVRRLGRTRVVPVDIRVVAATNRDLQEMIREGTFRDDLYYRLATYPIEVPPLCERERDAVAIARHFLRGKTVKGKRVVLDRDAEQVILGCSWPGNVRQLRNVLDKAVVDATRPRISAQDLRAAIGDQAELPEDTAVGLEPPQAILALLAKRGPLGGREIRERLDLAKTTAQRHLRGLRRAGLIVVQGQGRGIRYAIPEPEPPDHGDLDEDEHRVLTLLVERGPRTRRQVQAASKLSERTAQRRLASLVSSGLVEKVGKGRGMKYRASPRVPRQRNRPVPVAPEGLERTVGAP